MSNSVLVKKIHLDKVSGFVDVSRMPTVLGLKSYFLSWLFLPCLVFAGQTSTLSEKDPTAPLSLQKQQHTTVKRLQLQSILLSEERKLATINDVVLEEGEQSKGLQLLSVKPYYVVVFYQGKRQVLKLKNSNDNLQDIKNLKNAKSVKSS